MWYYLENGQPEGPVSETTLLAVLDRLGFETMVWSEGMPAWAPAREAGLRPPEPVQTPAPLEPAPAPPFAAGLFAEPPAPAPAPVAAAGHPASPAAAQPPQAAAGPSPAGEWGLTGRTGPAAGSSFRLEGRMTLGRSPQSDICITDDALSRNHAVVECGPEGCVLTDTGSTNGTFVNGVRISEPVALKNGDVIVCGTSELVVSGPAPAVSDRTVALSVEEAARLLRSLGFEQPPAQAPAPAPAPVAAAPAVSPAPFPAAQPTAEVRVCPHCGATVRAAAKFCVSCGGALR